LFLGGHKLFGMIITVAVGFLYMLNIIVS
jgi:hypothetical protein